MVSESLEKLQEKKSLITEAIKENGLASFYCPMCDEEWVTNWQDGIKHMCLNSRD